MLLTRRVAGEVSSHGMLSRSLGGVLSSTMDRRAFLKRSGLGAGAGAFAGSLGFSMIEESSAQDAKIDKIEVKRTVCTHCSVGCAIDAVVKNGVWVRHEPVFDSPIHRA